MISAIVVGVSAALIVLLPQWLRDWMPRVSWHEPALVLVVGLIAALLQRAYLSRIPGNPSYDGSADVYVHIPWPAEQDPPGRWAGRGLISFLLALIGATAGPEGAATELTHAASLKARPRSARWFERRRRTDAACAIAAAVSAAFGAPFAGLILSVELGLGGATISVALASLSAYWLVQSTGVLGFDVGRALHSTYPDAWREWAAILAIAVLGGIASVAYSRLVRYFQDNLAGLSKGVDWLRIAGGSLLLALTYWVFPEVQGRSPAVLENVLLGHKELSEIGLLFFTQLVSLALIVSAFGTVGILWPLFALGGYFGAFVDHGILQGIPGFGVMAGLVGASAFFGGALGVPLTGAILALEMTGNISVLIPCLIGGFAARGLNRLLRGQTLINRDLQARGLSVMEGRAGDVLSKIRASDAMVTDFETANERETVKDLYPRMIHSNYPFLPVVNDAGKYVGLLSADMVQEGWEAQDPLASNAPLSGLLEAKDLLYRARTKTPTLKVGDPLSAATRLFEQLPCLPVLADDGTVKGLLMVYAVRLAYEREVARLSHRPSRFSNSL